MKRTTINIPNDTHEGLKEIALEHNTSVAKLIRRAVERAYGEDIEDIRVMEEELNKYYANPASAIRWNELRRQLKLKGRIK